MNVRFKEFEGGIIVSHDFCECPWLGLNFLFLIFFSFFIIGLISQVVEELWEVANKMIKNLTKHDISIVNYKKNLVRESKYHFTVME